MWYNHVARRERRRFCIVLLVVVEESIRVRVKSDVCLKLTDDGLDKHFLWCCANDMVKCKTTFKSICIIKRHCAIDVC